MPLVPDHPKHAYTVTIELRGPKNEEEIQKFKADVDALLAKYRDATVVASKTVRK
jgi:hypothetical protein